jgi:putative ABC transport system permease protein
MAALIRLIALRQLAARPGRSALAVVGIALGVALVLSVQLINRSTLAALRDTIEGAAGRAQLQVGAASDAGLPEDVLEKIRAIPEVTLAVPLVEGRALVDDGRGEPLAVFGIDLGDDASVRTYRGVTEDADRVIDDPLVFLAQPDSVVVTRAFATARGLGLGDAIPVMAPTGARRLTVRGLLDPSGIARVYGTSLAVMDVFAAQRLLGREGRFDRVDLVLRDGTDIDATARALEGRLPAGLEVTRPAQRGEQVEGMLRAFQAMLSSTSLIGLMVAVFIIYNSLATVVVERRAEIGILRAVGARRRDVLMLHLAEALGTGMLGALVGCVLGTVLAHLLAGAVTGSAVTALSIDLAPPRLDLGPTTIVVAVAAGLGAIVLAALLPALEAARLPTIEAIRREAPSASPSRGGRWLAGGAALGAVALVCAVAAVRMRAIALGYVAQLGLLGAIALLCVPAVLLSVRVTRPLGARLFGVSGLLAGELGRRMPLRIAITVAGLTIGLSMSAGFAVVARSFDVSVHEWIHSWSKHDFFVRSSARERGFVLAPVPAALAAGLRIVPGVESVTTFRMIRQRYGGDTVTLAASSEAELHGRLAWLSDNFARRYRKHQGDRVVLATPRGRRAFRVARIERSYNSDRGTVTIAAATFRRLWGDHLLSDLGVTLTPNADPTAVRAEILRRFGSSLAIQVLAPKAIEAEILAGVARAFTFTRGLEAVTLLVAFLGVFDTVLASVLARRREVGILRAIGTRRREVAAAFGLEGLWIGALGGGLGLAAGLALAALWILVLFPDLLGYIVDVHVPVGRLGLIGLAALAVAVAAAALPARRAARLTVTDALAGD